MPQVGNKCPGMREYHSFESGHCLNSCDHQCVPASVLVHIQHKQAVDKHRGFYISATALSGCLRQLYFERTLEYYVEPPKNWWMLRGTLLHNILENPGDYKVPNWVSETTYQWPTGQYVCNKCGEIWFYAGNNVCPACTSGDIEPIIIYGTLDVLRPDTGELIDYKTIGDMGLSIIKDGAKKEHVMQFNIYRLFAERGHPKDVDPKDYKPVKINKIVAYYMTMMKIVRTGGLLTEDTIWRVSEPEDAQNLVGKEVLNQKQELKTKKGKRKNSDNPDDFELQTYKKYRLTYAVPDVPLMNLDDVAQFIRDTAPILVRAFKHGVTPPMCPPEMREWKCDGYCPDQIREACDRFNEKVGEKRIVEKPSTEIQVEAA